MLHELSHIVVGPHNSQFHALWNQLRDEHEALALRGYTGEGFLSEGRRLGGGRQLPQHEIRRQVRAQAEKRARQPVGTGGGQRLGGHAIRPGTDMRGVIARATEQRNRVLKGCGNVDHDQNEMEKERETANRNGFQTQAEEDAANEAAIAQALWELVQEEEKHRYGDDYIPPSAQNPAGNGGRSQAPQLGQDSGAVSQNVGNGGRTLGASAPAPPPVPPRPEDWQGSEPSSSKGWACHKCTYVNQPSHLCCDLCYAEKGSGAEPSKTSNAKVPAKRPDNSAAPLKSSTKPSMWMCSYCGTNMELKWWTCTTCGRMKDKS